jgi:hypothetical protein
MKFIHNNYLINKNYIKNHNKFNLNNDYLILEDIISSEILNLNYNILKSINLFIKLYSDKFFNYNFTNFSNTAKYLDDNSYSENIINEKLFEINIKKDIMNILNDIKINLKNFNIINEKYKKNCLFKEYIYVILLIKHYVNVSENKQNLLTNNKYIKKIINQKYNNYCYIYNYYFEDTLNILEYKQLSIDKERKNISKNIFLIFEENILENLNENDKKLFKKIVLINDYSEIHHRNINKTNKISFKNENMYIYKTTKFLEKEDKFSIYDSTILNLQKKYNIKYSFIEKDELSFNFLKFDNSQLNKNILINKDYLYLPLWYSDKYEEIYTILNNYTLYEKINGLTKLEFIKYLNSNL